MDKDVFKLLRSVMITSNKSRIARPSINAELSYRKPINPSIPINIQATMLKNQVVITWDKCFGATDYIIYLDGEQIGHTRVPIFEYYTEINGNITVRAYNKFYQSGLSEPIYVKTIPNAPIQVSVTSSQTTDGYEFTLGFVDNSDIETSYRLDYVIDNEYSYTRPIVSTVSTGEYVTIRFATPDISNKIELKVVAINELGENDLAEPVVLFVAPTPRWTYLDETKEVLLVWKNNVSNVLSYELKYELNNDGTYHIETLEIDDGTLNAEVRHKIRVYDDDILKISMCARTQEQSHLYSKFTLASKDRDYNLTPPNNFKYIWESPGVAKVTWEDIYNCELGFELVYILNDGQEKSVYIPSTSMSSVGTTYQYVHDFEGVASAFNVKVRMVWDLNTSKFTDAINITYYPTSGLPPSWVIKNRYDNLLEVMWEAQEYVEVYKIHYTVNNNTKIYETTHDRITIDMDLSDLNEREVYIVTHFSGGVISDKSKIIRFTPINDLINSSMLISNDDKNPYDLRLDIIQKNAIHNEVLHTRSYGTATTYIDLDTLSISQFLTSYGILETNTWGINLESKFSLYASISNTNLINSETDFNTISIFRGEDKSFVETIITTWNSLECTIYTEINKVRIVTIGDSITAGHPNYWAETGTGMEQSQYQYWLNRRLKGAYEILNRGYGSDTTDKILARFDKDVLSYNAQYCIIQGGTNDLYWAMAENNGDQAALDRKIQTMKSNIMEMVKRCWDNGIVPVVGTLIPRTGATGIYKTALYDFNDWIKEYCTENENIFYSDWFNAGKDANPPTPLEDPLNPGALNPIYDGDALFDEYGNLIKQGRGIHPSPEGYKIIGDSIPLSIFRTYETGLKLYLDSECTMEEDYNDDDKLNPYYVLNIDNIRRGKKKTIVRYIKNIGISQVLYAINYYEPHNLSVWFEDEDGNKSSVANGILNPDKSIKVIISMIAMYEDNKSDFNLYLASREIKTE